MVRVGRLELPASCSQSKRATNCATPGYEIFQLWSNMGSTPVFDQFPARGKSPSALASQNFPGFWGSAAQTPASRSQSRRATNCATPRYEVVGLPGRLLPNCVRTFKQHSAALFDAFRCSASSSLELFCPACFKKIFRLLGFVWDWILYIKRCSVRF